MDQVSATPVPMLGDCIVDVIAAKPFAIHGDQYIELHVSPISDAQTHWALRVPVHAFKARPIIGSPMKLSFLMGQVTEAAAVPV